MRKPVLPSSAMLPRVKQTAPIHVPHPARNLGAHMKPPKGGEYVTNHHRGARKPR